MDENKNKKCPYIKIVYQKIPLGYLPNEEVIHAWYKFNCFVNRDFLKDDWNRDKNNKSD